MNRVVSVLAQIERRTLVDEIETLTVGAIRNAALEWLGR